MRVSMIVGAGIVALAALASAEAWAATTIKGSKSNGCDKITDAASEKDCVDRKGAVYTNKVGDKVCVLSDTAAGATRVAQGGLFSRIAVADAAGEKDCGERKGMVYTGKSGDKICVQLPPSPATPPATTPPAAH